MLFCLSEQFLKTDATKLSNHHAVWCFVAWKALGKKRIAPCHTGDGKPRAGLVETILHCRLLTPTVSLLFLGLSILKNMNKYCVYLCMWTISELEIGWRLALKMLRRRKKSLYSPDRPKKVSATQVIQAARNWSPHWCGHSVGPPRRCTDFYGPNGPSMLKVATWFNHSVPQLWKCGLKLSPDVLSLHDVQAWPLESLAQTEQQHRSQSLWIFSGFLQSSTRLGDTLLGSPIGPKRKAKEQEKKLHCTVPVFVTLFPTKKHFLMNGPVLALHSPAKKQTTPQNRFLDLYGFLIFSAFPCFWAFVWSILKLITSVFHGEVSDYLDTKNLDWSP